MPPSPSLPDVTTDASGFFTVEVSSLVTGTYNWRVKGPDGVVKTQATDPPGFTDDESLEELGNNLRLPPWMEKAREQIEGVLTPITLPTKATS